MTVTIGHLINGIAQPISGKVLHEIDIDTDPNLGTSDTVIPSQNAVKEYVDDSIFDADASTIVKGITKLSIAPVSASNPIAVGDNDLRNSNSRSPTVHASAHIDGTDDIQSATISQKGLLTSTDWTTFNSKQDTLVSGTNIKTVEGQYLLGAGNIDITKTDVGLGNVDNTSDVNKPVSTAQQTALDLKVDENAAITGATKTKITYDTKGLVTSGADATTADINDSTNRRYVTDAQLVVVGNTSGTNTGDQTSIVGITGTKAQFDAAVTDGNILFVGDITQYTDEQAQDAVGTILDASLVYDDVTPSISRAALTGDVTASQGSNATTIANGAVGITKLSATGTPSATTYLRGDNTWASPASSVAMNSVNLSVGTPIEEYSETVTYASCLTSSKIIAAHSPTSELDPSSDEIINVKAFPLNGSFILKIQPPRGDTLFGDYTINFIIQ